MSKLEKVKQEVVKYDYVRFSLCDLNGTSRGHVIKGRHAAKYLEHGLAFFEGTLAFGPRTEVVMLNHENNHFFGNMNIFPDPDTLRPIPWAPGCMKVAEMLCESRWMKDNTPQMACPRYAARKQFQRLADLGYDFCSGHEIEFTLLDETLQPVNVVPDGYSLRLMNKHSKILFHFDKNFEDSNISVERYHPEFSRGMFEAVTTPKYGIDSLDMAFNLQQGLLEMADLKGLTATFMSQPFYNESGLCAHLNFSLWTKSGENVFYDADAADNLSVTAKQWIAGILKHSKALHAFTSPTVNCYRNMGFFLFASSINWGIENRAACIRVKNDGPLRTYIENRLPSSKSNAYLVAASTIAAGLDGVIKKMECPPPGITEHDEPLPRSLAEALEELEQDEVLCDALGKELVTWFVKSKRDADITMFEGVETDEERFAIEKKAYL
ncbi:lengsin-like [Haliotis cracherodii]|uniref:lengsin-like n=1 Tax=Haliotis cracherodii TaxID=6455 RepID=UPI0039EBFEF3